MTAIDVEHLIPEQSYLLGEEAVSALTAELVAVQEPYFYNGKTFSDGAVISGLQEGRSVYLIDSKSPFAAVSRALEARIYNEDKKWQQDKSLTARYHEGLEDNVKFILAVDTSQEGSPQAVGTLRIADVQDADHSGLFKYFKEAFPQSDDLERVRQRIAEEDTRAFDIVDLGVLPEYRGADQRVASWLYYGLARLTLDEGCNYWIASVNDHEKRQLDRMGIGVNFVPITDKKATYDDDGQLYGFYEADPHQVIREAREYALELLTAQSRIKQSLGALALIATTGRDTPVTLLFEPTAA
jgi:hypothetical protein